MVFERDGAKCPLLRGVLFTIIRMSFDCIILSYRVSFSPPALLRVLMLALLVMGPVLAAVVATVIEARWR